MNKLSIILEQYNGKLSAQILNPQDDYQIHTDHWVSFDWSERIISLESQGQDFQGLLCRAIQGRKKQAPRPVIDASAGLGGDALYLAYHGHRVLAFERDEVVFKLLSDAKKRALDQFGEKHWISAIELIDGDFPEKMTAEMLREWSDAVVYYDPMYAQGGRDQKKRRTKKEMQFLREYFSLKNQGVESKASEKDDRFELIEKSLKLGIGTFVIKGPRKSKPLELAQINHNGGLEGKTTRYDRYLAKI